MSREGTYNLFGSIIFIIGLGLVAWKTGWIIALGLFLVVWGNNIERSSTKQR